GYGNANIIGDNETPANVGSINVGAQVRQVVTGYSRTCVVLKTGPVKCWGSNNHDSFAGPLGMAAGAGGLIGDHATEVPAMLANVTVWGGCADATSEQTFLGDHAVGCAGSTNFSLRQNFCAPGWLVCSANQWAVSRANGRPSHNYWTNDNLGWSGAGPGNCSASA